MPTLNWIGKKAVLNHDRDVPFYLLEEVPGLSFGDKNSGNLIVQGDNLVALKSLLPYYAGKVKCIYIDPPYNSKTTAILYKNNYKDSSWLSLMENRLLESRKFGEIPITVAIDENEQEVLSLLLGRFVVQEHRTDCP